ncbi:MAG: cell division protein FtsZ, partial [Nanoarchaeota archaeon]|nr:cell division protein FtsZ [Nanoarchaeota archaeon]
AVKGVFANPLLDISHKGAHGALIHIEGGPDMTLQEVETIGELVTESMDPDANVIWGARVSEHMRGKICVMTIMTGVTSPWILGKNSTSKQFNEMKKMGEELNIRIV